MAPEENEDHEGLLDKLRDVGISAEDPNIVGDVGQVDIPPARTPTAH